MKIVQAGEENIVEVLYLMRTCVDEMVKNGIGEWNKAFPTFERIQEELKNQELYILRKDGVCIGAISYSTENQIDDSQINWEDTSNKYLYIKRLVIFPIWQGKGIGKSLVEHIEKLAKEKGYKSVRLDVISKNKNINGFIEQQGFKNKGDIVHSEQSIPFHCFEKIL